MQKINPQAEDLQPDPAQRYYDARQFLLVPEDSAFINSAYYCILKRAPDDEGFKSYYDRLAKGGFRQQVLADLLTSEEAQTHAVTLTHLRSFLAWKKLSKQAPRTARLLHPAFWLLKRILKRIQYYQALQKRALFAVERAFALAIRENRDAVHAMRQRVEILEDRSDTLHSQFRLLKNHAAPLAIQQKSAHEGDLAHGSTGQEEQRWQTDFSDFYLEFEIAFRGSREAIRERLAHYLAFLPPAAVHGARVVDLGCGRGEWLSLLQASGYTAQGLDSNPVMLQTCRDKGLNVSGQPIHQWLHNQPDESFAAITAFHIAEHLPFDYLLAIVKEAKRLLQPGGVLIVETQNPESLRVSAYAFYHDPTHRNPLTPELLEFTAHYAGFRQVQLQRLSEMPEDLQIRESTETAVAFNRLLNAPRDLALIATQSPNPGENQKQP